MSTATWATWAVILILQNFAFTFVSRARNSGSLRRHLVAGFCSNGVWFVSQILIFSQLMAIMTGKYGIGKAVLTSLFYTVFTLIGSLWAHHYSLSSEKGKSAVGASDKYVQITPEAWAEVQKFFEDVRRVRAAGASFATYTPDNASKIMEIIGGYDRTKHLAEQAHVMVCDAMPTGAVACKIAGQTVVTNP